MSADPLCPTAARPHLADDILGAGAVLRLLGEGQVHLRHEGGLAGVGTTFLALQTVIALSQEKIGLVFLLQEKCRL